MTLITELFWGPLEIIYLLLLFVVGLAITFLFIPPIMKYMRKKGNVGFDIHKSSRPEIPESGGLSIVVGLIVVSIISIILFPYFLNIILVFLITIILAGIIGLIDDKKKLRSRYKIALTIFTGIPIFLANYFEFITISSPNLPFLGKTRVTMLYPFLIPFIVAVFANTTNMMEGYNGEGSGTCLIAVCFLFVCSLILFSAEAIILTIMIISVLIPFYFYNKYPSKVFPGDVGTLCMGTAIACIALFGSLEVAVFCAFLMHIFNSFYIISSVRGFLESSKIRESKADIIMLDDNRIKASYQKNAVLTLPRLILAKGPLSEKELVNNFYFISIICGYFSIIATLFIVWTQERIELYYVILVIVIFIVPTTIFLYKFNRIRGIIFLMIFLLIGGVIFLIIIDVYVMTLPFSDIDLIIVNIPINILITVMLLIPCLFLWYVITIKYFWYEINKMQKKEFGTLKQN